MNFWDEFFRDEFSGRIFAALGSEYLRSCFSKKRDAIIPDTYTPLFDAKQPLSWEAGICGTSILLTKTAGHFLEANKQNDWDLQITRAVAAENNLLSYCLE
jgi:hypothetical protein